MLYFFNTSVGLGNIGGLDLAVVSAAIPAAEVPTVRVDPWRQPSPEDSTLAPGTPHGGENLGRLLKTADFLASQGQTN